MKNEYLKAFFTKISNRGSRSDFTYLWIAIDKFLSQEVKTSAYDVYTSFFDCYRIQLQDGSFVDLLDALRSYEENSSVLLDKQRDHLVHSVNVFLLGMEIYTHNPSFQTYFKQSLTSYEGMYDFGDEEFLYRWGMAALLHDIGYPMEIIFNQLKKFTGFIVETNGQNDVGPFLGFFNFASLDSICEILYKSVFTKQFCNTLSSDITLDPMRPTHLLAYRCYQLFDTEFITTKNAIEDFLTVMQKKGFVDHGFFSAIILIKWYGYLVQKSGQSADVLYHPVLDAATAILMHNYYRNTFMSPPFSLGKLSASTHPLSYLLILCDELQEWNRTVYGIKQRHSIFAEASDIEVTGDTLKVHFLTSKGVMADNFGIEKKKFLQGILCLDDIFPAGIEITQTTSSDLYLRQILETDNIISRPLLTNLERMAQIIHQNHTAKRKQDGLPVEYPTWTQLPDTLKYSNIRQARSIFVKLNNAKLIVADQPPEGARLVTELSPEQLEFLAREEHDEWVAERFSNGWTHGERDAEKKTSPYLIPYSSLSEEIKDYDRDAVRNIFSVLNAVDLKVYEIL